MRIIEFRAENIKNLKVVEIKPDGNAIILQGKNGAGKSAVLDAILMALTGNKMDQPIRDGEARAEINIDLGDYKVRRIFTAKGERLELSSSEGAVFKTPQALLDKIIGKLAFDPLAFAEMGKDAEGMRKQRAMLASLVGIDFTELNKKREALYNERTVRNREIKGGDPTSFKKDPNAPLPLESLVGSMVKPADETPRVEISMAEELAKLQALEHTRSSYLEDCRQIRIKNQNAIDTRNRIIEEFKTQLEFKNNEVNRIASEVEELKKQLSQKITQMEGISHLITMGELELKKILDNDVIQDDLPAEPITEAEINAAREALKEIEEKNKAIRKAVEFDTAIARLELAKSEVIKLETEMAKLDLDKQNKLKEAVFPIVGLGMTDEFVTFQGKPLSQLSTGEQVRISTAVAMALNPTLKIVIIREGSLLDGAGRQAVIDMAKEKDYQVWLECVADQKGVGIYLEDGEIK